MVSRDKLSAGLRSFGFPLLEPEDRADANMTLAEVARSGDMRLWEAFPVLLANSADRGLFDPEKAKEHLKKSSDKENFSSLLAMAFSLFNVLSLKFPWAGPMSAGLDKKVKRQISEFSSALAGNQQFDIGGRQMSADRVKAVFHNYFISRDQKLGELLSEKEEIGFEYALSQVFSPKQKELFLKKLKGEPLTKTEREYYSRAVKKKILALANTKVHLLARKLLESP